MKFLGPLSLFLVSGLPAAPLTVVNHSFESPMAGPGEFAGATTSGPAAGWGTVYNTVAANNMRYFGVWNPSGTNSFVGGNAPDGDRMGVVFLRNTTNLAEAGLQQTLVDTLQLATQYTLTVEVGNFANAVSFDSAGFPGYRVELFAGNPLLPASILLASDINTLSPGEGHFETSVVSFTTGSSHTHVGQALVIRLVNLNGPGTEVNFDDVRLDATPVPPLGTWRFDNFGTTENTGNAAHDFDYDFDGLPNLIEYLLGSDPTVYDSEGAVTAEVTDVAGTDYLALTFDRDLEATGVTLSVRATSDLGLDLSNWESIDPDGANQVSSATTENIDTLTVRDNVPTNGATQRFMRLEVTEP